jgi:hypothetical protein
MLLQEVRKCVYIYMYIYIRIYIHYFKQQHMGFQKETICMALTDKLDLAKKIWELRRKLGINLNS